MPGWGNMSDNPNVHTTRLDNGMRVVTHAMPHLETVALGVWVNAGARHERTREHGVAHFLEHMAFKGTQRRSALDIAHSLEAVGGDLNAATSMETTAYYARVLKGDLPLAVDVLCDIFENPVFAAEELERERNVIIQEIAAARDTPDDLAFDVFQEAAFPGQALGRPILGTVESVGSFAATDLAGFRDARYHPERVVIGAAGAVEHDRLVDLAAAQFRGRPFAREALEPGRYEGGDIRIDKDLEQAHLLLGFEAPPYGSDDFYTAQVLASVLGGGMSSRLFQEVREKRGLCYSIFAFCSSYADTGLFGIYAGTSPDDLGEIVPVVADELNRLSGGIREEEVARSRAQFKAGLLMSLESSTARAEQISRQELAFGRVLPMDELIGRIDRIDAASVGRLAERMLAESQPTVAAVGPVSRLASHAQIAARFA